jgi:hypothetical protein
LLLGVAGPARATPELRERMRTLAEAINGVLREEKQQAVAFADVPADPFTGSNSGPGLQRVLVEELQAVASNSGVVRDTADVLVRCTYAAVDRTDALNRTLRVVQVEVVMVNRQGRELLRRKVIVDTGEDVARIFNVTGDLPLNANKEDLNKKIQILLEKPQVHVEKGKVFTAPGRPYAVELLVRAPGESVARTRPALVGKGKAFVDIRREEVYEIKVHNLADHEAAVTVSIDGLDVFTFSDDRDPKTGRSKFTHYIIPPRGTGALLGWHKTVDPKRKDNVLSFLVTEYGKGAASAQKAVGKVGAITVTFAAAWKGDDRPADEPTSRNAGGNETGFGPPRQVGFQEVRRTIGVVREVITVWYDRPKDG